MSFLQRGKRLRLSRSRLLIDRRRLRGLFSIRWGRLFRYRRCLRRFPVCRGGLLITRILGLAVGWLFIARSLRLAVDRLLLVTRSLGLTKRLLNVCLAVRGGILGHRLTLRSNPAAAISAELAVFRNLCMAVGANLHTLDHLNLSTERVGLIHGLTDIGALGGKGIIPVVFVGLVIVITDFHVGIVDLLVALIDLFI